MFIDTHCHLNIMVDKIENAPLTQENLQQIKIIVDESKDAGVDTIINVGTSFAESQNCITLAKTFKNVYATVGIHPTDCNVEWIVDFKAIKKLVENKIENKIVAIGETGLDFYHKPFNKQSQIDAFTAHIELAIQYSLPLVIHIREAADETLKVLEKYKDYIKGVNHCFSHTLEFANQLIEWGLFLGIDAPITYPKNESFRNVVAQLPLENIILETDAPFLPPQQFRGKQNHPKYIPIFAQTIAELKGISLFDLAAITTTNAQKLFGLEPK